MSPEDTENIWRGGNSTLTVSAASARATPPVSRLVDNHGVSLFSRFLSNGNRNWGQFECGGCSQRCSFRRELLYGEGCPAGGQRFRVDT